MSLDIIARSGLTTHSLLDEVMGVLARGERALYDDLAQAAWHPNTTLAALINSAVNDTQQNDHPGEMGASSLL